MAVSVLEAAVALRSALASFEPDQLSGGDCARVAEELSATEKACAAARLQAASRAAQTGAHRERGFADAAAWLAQQAGTTSSQARQELAVAERLHDCPDTRAALLAGEISLAQAGEISHAPDAERDLLEVARGGDLTAVRDQVRQVRQQRLDPEELRRRQFAAREFRHWRDRDGMVRFTGGLPPETGLPLVRRIEIMALRARRAGKAEGRDRERFEAYAADALVRLVEGGGISDRVSGPKSELVIVCDLLAWRRGHAHPGEPCHIVGGGPIPVEVAKDFASDAFVKTVLHDGTNIHTVKHFGRHLPAALRTALDLGPVPEFTGRACQRCGATWGLEYDHIDPVHHQGPTQFSNLQALCWKDHQIKTEEDRRAGLLGPHAPRAPDTS